MRQQPGVTNRQRLAGFEPGQAFKRGERVNVEFIHNNGTLKVYSGKFDSFADLGIQGERFGIVRLSKIASVMAPIEKIVRAVGRTK